MMDLENGMKNKKKYGGEIERKEVKEEEGVAPLLRILFSKLS